MRVWVLTLYPEYFGPFANCGVVGQMLKGHRGASVKLQVISIRDYALDKHASVDAAPYGGGAGMVMRADVLKNALEKGVLRPAGLSRQDVLVICPSARGEVWSANMARQMAMKMSESEGAKELIFVCGRFEGIDERFLQKYVDWEVSLGDYILTGGELAVMAILDSAFRFLPGTLGNKLSAVEESFSDGRLEYPHYTRPQEFEGAVVPEVLLSGHHVEIERFRRRQALEVTQTWRPDLNE